MVVLDILQWDSADMELAVRVGLGVPIAALTMRDPRFIAEFFKVRRS